MSALLIVFSSAIASTACHAIKWRRLELSSDESHTSHTTTRAEVEDQWASMVVEPVKWSMDDV